MAYDASFLTGSNEMGSDPLTIHYFNNDQAVSDMEEGVRQISIEDGKLKIAQESFEQLTELEEFLAHDCNHGKIFDAMTYRIITKQIDSICYVSGTPMDPMPAMEDVNVNHPRDLTFALENVVTETLSTIWQTIKNAFISAHNKIKTWYIKAFDGSSRLLNQAQALKGKAEGMSSATPRENNFTMAGAKFLNINGKVASPQEIGQGVKEISAITGNLLTTNAETYNKMFEKYEKILKDTTEQAKQMKDSNASPGEDKDKQQNTSIAESFGGIKEGTVNDASGNTIGSNGEVNKLIASLVGEWGAMAKAAGIDLSKKVENDNRFKTPTYRNPKDLLGSIMLIASFPTEPSVTTVESYADFKAGFRISPEPILEKPREIDDNGTFITAQPSIVIGICEDVISACETFVKYKLLFDARDKATGNLMKQMEQAVSSNSNLKGAGQKHMNNSISATVALVKKSQDGETRWSKYAMSVLNKAIVYCRQSLAQY